MTLTEFLLARIEEEERAARSEQADAMTGFYWKGYPKKAYEELQSRTLATSGRVIAECEVKRRIVATMQTAMDHAWQNGEAQPVIEFIANRTLVALATVYADHPDRPHW